jgi:hypothetical protein
MTLTTSCQCSTVSDMDPRSLDRLRIPVRRADIERLLEAEAQLTSEERKVRKLLTREHALDLGIPDMPRYGALFAALVAASFGRRFERALWHPEEFVDRRWPLNSTEMATLLEAVDEKVSCSARTIDRLALEELIAAPLVIGEGEERPLRVYFGRHFVEVAYWQLNEFRPAVEKARLDAVRADLDPAHALYWKDHPSLSGASVLARSGRR